MNERPILFSAPLSKQLSKIINLSDISDDEIINMMPDVCKLALYNGYHPLSFIDFMLRGTNINEDAKARIKLVSHNWLYENQYNWPFYVDKPDGYDASTAFR